MNRTATFWGRLCFLLVLGACCAPARVAAQNSAPSSLPALSQALASDKSSMLYCDVTAIRRSGVWRAIARRLPALGKALEQNAGAQLGNVPDLERLKGLSALPWDKLAEVVLVANVKDPGAGLKPDESILALARVEGDVDVDELVSSLAKLADEFEPGLGSSLAASRRKVGDATLLDVPKAKLKEGNIPFDISGAVVPALGHTLMGVGRKEALEAFLAGKTADAITSRASRYLPTGAALWTYAPISEDATRQLSAPGNELQGNPMLQAMLQGFAKVKETYFGLTFGEKSLGINLALVCKDDPAGAELGGVLQGLVGFAQMAAQQNPSLAASGALRGIRVNSQGAAVQVSTTVSLSEIEQGFAKAGIQATPQEAGPGSSTPGALSEPPPTVEVEFLGMLPVGGGSVRWCRLKVQNRADQPIKVLRLDFTYWNAAGQKLGSWTRRHTDLDADNVVGPKSDRITRCPVSQMPDATAKISVLLDEAIFADGERWSPDR